MESLIIEETKYTPSIKLDASKGILELIGKSYPENTFEFYKPMMDWVEKYFKGNEQSKTVVNMEIIYFNSSSSKLFFDFFDLLEEAHNNGKNIEINWIYDEENESAMEAGEDFKEDFESLMFNLIVK
ncbi:DUF1987 domain-containing protein [Halarcobacter anaerophilus]|jgi:hypothetical protein|uniref:DUF1987 domain-containing protein n=1 Tax=Halarcobacter anaerophilus TaxID=877500 RepID=A0A4Q0Y0A1_9BACT|nr:DUF1987 domain-containing protein [Halarcobacter anaerophilus]QDF28455.1 DUF1987 domain-containing protein [Halarcobacter anaerophilus]RXJ61631.1 DUF1987 domain-containing protein [Halarcobacter anaerophilus]